MRIFSALLCISMLVACSQEVPAPSPSEVVPEPAAAVGPQSRVVPVEPGKQAPNRLDSEHFSVVVANPGCGDAATATVKWDASGEGVTGVAIYVESPGNERKLWNEGGVTGEATTGPWIFANTLFVLKAKDSGDVLAKHVVDSIACQK